MLKPNRTPITATILSEKNEEQNFDIVILSIVGKIVLPAFLWAGKIVSIDARHLVTEVEITKGEIISADIEVFGDPFVQKYELHNISKLESTEDQSDI